MLLFFSHRVGCILSHIRILIVSSLFSVTTITLPSFLVFIGVIRPCARQKWEVCEAYASMLAAEIVPLLRSVRYLSSISDFRTIHRFRTFVPFIDFGLSYHSSIAQKCFRRFHAVQVQSDEECFCHTWVDIVLAVNTNNRFCVRFAGGISWMEKRVAWLLEKWPRPFLLHES